MTKRRKVATPPVSPRSDDSGSGSAGGGGGFPGDDPPLYLRAEDRHKNGKPRPSANARERERMRVLSKAFSRLKTTLPWVPADTKLSKLDTLRLACSYIAHLKQILDEGDPGPAEASSGGRAAGTGGGGGSAASRGGSGGGAGGKQPEPAAIHPLALTWPYTFNGKVTAAAPDQKKPTTTPSGKTGGSGSSSAKHAPCS